MYCRGRLQSMTNVSDAAYTNRLRKQNSISTTSSLQFCCINENAIGLYEGLAHRPLYILLHNLMSTCSQPSLLQLGSIISDHRWDVEIN